MADGVSRHARRSFVPGRICDRGVEISRTTTGRAVLIGGGWGRGRERFSPNADQNDARRSIEPNEPDSSFFLVIVGKRNDMIFMRG
jgi:hypothetical protein